MNRKRFQNCLSLFLSFLLIAVQVSPLQAAYVDNGGFLTGTPSGLARDDLQRLAGEQAARDRLRQLGVDPAEVRARIASMTDAELAEVNRRIGDLQPGEGLGSLLLVLFIVFIITDMLGATDIFPFVHPINR